MSEEDEIMYEMIKAGNVIQRGDLFRADDGRLLGMDNLGRILGLRVLGREIKKSGAWFRPLPNSASLGNAKQKG